MTIGNLPQDNSRSYESAYNPKPQPKTSHSQQTALKTLASTANATAEDSFFSQKAVEINQPTQQGGLLSYVSYAAGELFHAVTGAVAAIALPAPGYYNDKISRLQQSLYEQTGAHIAAETAKVLAKRQVHKFRYFLTHLSPDVAQIRSLKKFITIQGNNVELSHLGREFLNILENHTTLLEETFEVNMLLAMDNAIGHLHTMQRQNPFFLVELVQETLQQVVAEANKPAALESAAASEEEHAQFMNKLQHNIMRVVFPNNEADVEIPRNLQGWLSKNTFLQIQEKALPRKMDKLFNSATSEITKYKLLAKAVKELKKILSTESSKSAPAEKATGVEIHYPQQEQFNQALLDAASTFINHIDSKLLRTLKPHILKNIQKQGPKLVEKLATLDINNFLNNTMRSACKKLSPEGCWGEKDGKEVFYFVPTNPKTPAERAAHDARTAELNKQNIDATIATIATDLEGLIGRLAKGKSNSPPATGRLEKIKESLRVFYRNIRKGVIRIAFKVFRADKQITELSKKVLNFAEQLDLKRAAKPFKKVVLKK